MRVYTTDVLARNMLTDKTKFKGHRFIPGEGDASPHVILVRGAPTWGDFKAGKAFMGEDGIAIRSALVKEGITFYATTAFPFFLPNETMKLEDGRQFAHGYLRELRGVDTKRVALFGAEAVKLSPFLDVSYKKFNQLWGRTFDVGEFQVRVFQHPSQVTRVPSLYREFIEDMKEFVWPKNAQRSKPEGEAYLVYSDKQKAIAYLRTLPQRGAACDTETTSVDPYDTEILTIQFSTKEGVGHAIPWNLLTLKEWDMHLDNKSFIFQNGSFDVKVLANKGIHVKIHEDTMLMHSLVDETPGTHSLELMAQRYLGVDKWSSTINYDDMASNDIKTLGEYGARDTDLTLRLANVFRPMVQDRPIHPVLTKAQNAIIRAELRGIKVNRDLAHEFMLQLAGHLQDKAQMLKDSYGLENANSPAQVSKLLYEKMGLPVQKLQGKVTTNENAMEYLAKNYNAPVTMDILEYRHLTKAKGTYVEKILALSERDGRYHPDFKLAATETGRLAEPLILLIPRPGDSDSLDLGQKYQARLRELFIPDDGHVMIGADYSGLEVSMAAHLTKDPQLIEDVLQKLDTHSVVAIQAFGLKVPLEPYDTLKKRVSEKFKVERDLAKQATFTWLYGGSEGAIKRQLGISETVAASILAALRTRYPGVALWHEMVREGVQREAAVSTPWGRSRRFFFHSGLERKVTEEQLRESTNAPIQGMSSDMTLAAFTTLTAMGYKTLFPLHDAIYMQVPADRQDKGMADIREVMEGVLKGPVPFRCDVKAGQNWGQLG